MEKSILIFECPSGHFFINGPICPFCSAEAKKTFLAKNGDCVSCGYFCPTFLFGCNEPSPITEEINFSIENQSLKQTPKNAVRSNSPKSNREKNRSK